MVDQRFLDDYWEYWRLSRGTRDDRIHAGGRRRSHEAVDDAVEAGEPGVVELLVALAEAAPSEEDAGLIGAGPIEELLSCHAARLATPAGADLVDAIDTAARRSARFRRALKSAYMGDEVPMPVKSRLGRFFAAPST